MKPGRDPAQIARLCERVYRAQLRDGGARMQADDRDDGTRLRRRAMAYEATVRAVLDALDAEAAAPAPDAEARFAAMLRAGWLPEVAA